MQGKYISKNDTNNYSPYIGPRIIKKYITSDTVNYVLKEVLEEVVTFPEHKVELLPIQEKSASYYLYGTNEITLSSVFYDDTTYNVVRMPNETIEKQKNYEVTTLGITTSDNRKEYSNFELDTKIYYILASEKIIIYGDKRKRSEWYIWNNDICKINHNLNGIIDFTLRKYNSELDNYGEELYNINNEIKDLNTILLTFSDIQAMDIYELIIWKIDSFDSKLYQNVFTSQCFLPDDVSWKIYNTKEEFNLELNYRFSFIGYNTIHNLATYYNELYFDPSKETNLSTIVISNINELTPKARTLNTFAKIVKDYQYIINYDQEETESKSLITKKIQVLVPEFENYNNYKEDCQNIYIYTSILSQTIYVDTTIPVREMENYNIKNNNEIIIIHQLNGIVKIRLRNICIENYKTYIISNNQIKIVFDKDYKEIPKSFYVDLFLIWSEDNNETK